MELKNIESTKLQYFKMGHSGPKNNKIRVNNLYWEENGVPKLPVMGEFHYNRMDERYWRESLMKMKASGVNIVSTYILWILHEEFEGRQNWSGRNNLHRFVELCGELGLKVHLRIGPYCNAEIRNGGFPDWMENNENFRCRTNDPLYLKYVRYWYQSIFNQVKDLLYKDAGPIVAIQLENEYVTPGMVVSHIMALKEIAIEEGFDVPVYSMTHWMMSDYPKGEVIPYAGYYLETPWISYGNKENPTTDQEFFSYNRISENIGNDFIKTTGSVETLEGEGNDSPYFTCEVGVGTPNYYIRRAVVPKELAGETITLRLGCGVNLLGYYMYVGQTDPIGEQYTMARATARISNDYQAPIKEFGTLGASMKETKKLNYFMNDFGHELAPMRAYLPVANKNRENLQWAVRTNGKSGYVFCSNYLYKHDRKDYKNVQFELALKDETIRIPHKKMTIKNGAYFFWPFNMDISGVTLQYATAQPICTQKEKGIDNYFFFANEAIPAELKIDPTNIEDVVVANGKVSDQKNSFFIDQLIPGKECVITITKKDGKKIRLVVLDENDSDLIWKGSLKGKDFVYITESTILLDSKSLCLEGESSKQHVWKYESGKFTNSLYDFPEIKYQTEVTPIGPFYKANRIKPSNGRKVQRNFNAKSLSNVERAYIRFQASMGSTFFMNNEQIKIQSLNNYQYADVTKYCKNGINNLKFVLDNPQDGVLAEMEVLLENGTRWIWNTDCLWTDEDGKNPVQLLNEKKLTTTYAPEEHLSVFNISIPANLDPQTATRLYLNITGDVANAYVGSQLIHDVFNNGADWIIGLNRYSDLFENNPNLTIRIDGLKNIDNNIYFEKNVSKQECLQPFIKSVKIRQEYSIPLKL